MKKVEIYKRVKGPMDNYEDWYYLQADEESFFSVLHEWSHVSPNLKTNTGSKQYTIEDFLASSDVHTGAQAAVREKMRSR
ncbi:hypothetical protein [Ruegeria arenilitoris]|uniref:hypothetical protein n=1 Tax=Ruegeria arenilitoris TaxID=1173585 RepID=UPI00147CF612|nr:hypothetical protein [Ruegeria arenilitoris]